MTTPVAELIYYPKWITRGGDLGVVPENEFYLKELEVHANSSGDLQFYHISGELPPGIQITRHGTIQGTPVVVEGFEDGQQTYEFSVRVKNSLGYISDRTFSITVSKLQPPYIVQRDMYIGDFFDGTYMAIQLLALSLPRAENLQWTLESGELPNGVTMSSTGLISGYIFPLPAEGPAGAVGFDATRYEQFNYDSTGQYRNNTYTFTVRLFDGANFDRMTYRMHVVARPNWTADNDIDLVTSNFLTVDWDNRYVPIVITPPQLLPTVRSDNYFAFKFDAIDPEYRELVYEIANLSRSEYDSNLYDSDYYSSGGSELPPGLTIDPETGWLSGYIPPQTEVAKNYVFEIVAYRKDEPEYRSKPVQYRMTVLSNVVGVIEWESPSFLGILTNGNVSQFQIKANTSLNRELIYSLVENSSRLPQGLRLLPNGLIVGRTTFQYFSLDSGLTTIDKGKTTFDTEYHFTVQVKTNDGTIDRGLWTIGRKYVLNDVVRYNDVYYVCVESHVSDIYGPDSTIEENYWAEYRNTVDTKRFTIKIDNYNKRPFENLYIRALPSRDQRDIFMSILNNKDIFPDELIYRIDDPWFGKAKSIRSLFLSGLEPSSMAKYIEAMKNNHFTKRIEFGNVKTARALDENFKTKYEVVYLELTDPISNNGNMPDQRIDLTHKINPFIDPEGNPHSIYTPNGFGNMRNAMSNHIGFSHRGSLPEWMTSTQENSLPLGFTHAVVLAYTIPGASKLIAYRLKANGIEFNNIEFKIDRYELDNYLSRNFIVGTQAFITDSETTFDRIHVDGKIEHHVDYAVTVPFDNVDNRTIGYINARGGLDGVKTFKDGDTIIFKQQENFAPSEEHPFMEVNSNNGWNRWNGVSYDVVTGYLDTLLDPSIPNHRAGMWRIRIIPAAPGVDPNAPEHGKVSDFGNPIIGFDNKPYDYIVDWDGPPWLQKYDVVRLEPVAQYDHSPLWIPDTTYLGGISVIKHNDFVYRCLVTHVSDDFEADNNLGYWEKLPVVKLNDMVQVNNGYSNANLVLKYDSNLLPNHSSPSFTLHDAELVNSDRQTRFDNHGTRFFDYRDYYNEPVDSDKYLKFPKTGVFY